MARLDPAVLRLELLRTRAALERAALRAAVFDLSESTAPLRSVLALVSGRGRARNDGVAATVRSVVGLLRERPWLLSAAAAVVGRQGVRRWFLLGAVALLVAVVVRRVVEPRTPRAGDPGEA